MSEADISSNLGKKTISGQINRNCENSELSTKRLGTRRKSRFWLRQAGKAAFQLVSGVKEISRSLNQAQIQ